MSPRTGRPKVDKPKDIRYSIRLDKELEEKLVKYCEVHKTSKGEVFRQALVQFLDA
jgi:predicted transcriptional regulator